MVERVYACRKPGCGFEAESFDELIEHLWEEHSMSTPRPGLSYEVRWRCEYCGRWFRRRDRAEEHELDCMLEEELEELW